MGFLENRDLSSVPTIPEYYKGKTVFITGGSGFIGKVLIEKLLYSCTELDRIYLLLRNKKGATVEERLRKLFSNECFNRLKRERPGVFERKVFVVAGDVLEDRLGISEEDRRLLVNRVNIIFHSAASVRFDDHLSYAIKLNLQGTLQVLELAKEIKNLSALIGHLWTLKYYHWFGKHPIIKKSWQETCTEMKSLLDIPIIHAFVHVSTMYSNTNRGHYIDEAIYTPHADWRDTLKICKEIDSHTLEVFTPKFLNDMPNTYTFSKQLAEHAVYENKGQLPLAILRPSIVVSSLDEPVPGWIDNFNGPIGLCIAGGKGIMHSLYAKPDVKCDYIPVDCCVKNIIAVSWIRGTKPLDDADDVPIYNSCAMDQLILTMKELMQHGIKSGQHIPLDNALWAIHIPTLTTSRVRHYTEVVLTQLLPALFIDTLLYLLGRKPKLIKIQRVLYRSMTALAYYMTNEWTFKKDNSLSLCSRLKEKDKYDFNYDVKVIDIGGYFDSTTLLIRRSLLHEKDEDIEKAKAHCQRLWWLDKIIKMIVFVFICKYLYIKYFN